VPLQISKQSSITKNLKQKDSFAQNIDELSFLKRYFEAIKRGHEEDIQFLKKSLEEDPNRLVLDSLHPKRRANVVNYNGEFPLYCAAKYNNIGVLFLLTKGREILYRV
jgi:hypothetical protein